MAIPSAIMAIISAIKNIVVIPSATKIKTLALIFGVPPAIWLLHQPKCSNSTCHLGNNISHIHVTFHLSQSLSQKNVGFIIHYNIM